MDNFRQAVESPKIWNSMGYICPKNTFLQLKHCMQRIYFTFNYLCENSPNCWCHFWNHKVIFHDATRMYYFSSNIIYFWQKYSIRVQIFRFLTIRVKIHQIFLVIFQAKSEFFSKFGSLFSVMTDNSFVLFHLKLYMILTKGIHQVQIFRLSTARMKINQIPCHFSSHDSVFT